MDLVKKNKKIIQLFLILGFVILPFHTILAYEPLNFDDPFKESAQSRKYKFSPSSQLLKNVGSDIIMCTNAGEKLVEFAVNKIDGAYTKFLENRAVKNTEYCEGDFCEVRATDTEVKVADPKTKEETAKNTRRENCYNGIAYNLAKSQLSSMTKNTLSWVNTGFQGDPFYIQNMDSYNDSLVRDSLIKTTTLIGASLGERLYPYGMDVARSLVNDYKNTKNFGDSMVSTLSLYLPPGVTNDQYASDFSLGGWDAWLSLTQRESNNPLGFSVAVSQYQSDQENKIIAQKKDTLDRNDGMLDHTDCKWSEQPADIRPDSTPEETQKALDKWKESRTCLKEIVLTPGFVIKEKLVTTTNLSETQLLLADSINESLASVFSNMIDRMRSKGLKGLTDVDSTDFSDSSFGIGSNSFSYDNGTFYGSKNQSFSGFNGAFDITRDLGDLKGPNDVLIKRGIISDQIVYVNEVNKKPKGSLVTLPKITPAVGELDYCIPGPNPAWRGRAEENLSKYIGYLYGFVVKVEDARKKAGWTPVCNSIIDILNMGVFKYSVPGLITNTDTCKSPIKEYLSNPNPNEYNNIFKNSSIFTANKNEEFYKVVLTYIQDVFAQNHDTDGKMNFLGVVIQSPTLRDTLELQQKKWEYTSENLYRDYVQDINKKYSPMTNPNAGTAYLQMAANGLDFTKNLDDYSENTTAKIEEYKTQISKSKANQIELCIIKKEVDEIVEIANKRRNDQRASRGEALVSLTCNLPPNTTYTDPCGNLNINITNETGKAVVSPLAPQCSDGIDNDGDGFMDDDDQGCYEDKVYNPKKTTEKKELKRRANSGEIISTPTKDTKIPR